MSEIKHTFQAGKMNKDLDERLVPQGEYRDALNIEVRTSDGGDAGTAQTSYGTIERLASTELELTNSWAPYSTTMVGSVADEKADKAYFFLASPPVWTKEELFTNADITELKIFKDLIIQYDTVTKSTKPVVVDIFEVHNTHSNLGSPAGNVAGFTSLTLTAGVTNTLRPGMAVQAYNTGGTSLMSVSTDTFLAGDPIIRKVVGNIIYFDRVVATALTTALYWKFIAPKTLNFSRNTVTEKKSITGINIIDNFLFWTDNFSEPKKINIDRCIAGTPSFSLHSNLMITSPESALDTLVNINTIDIGNHGDLKEEHITVIRRAPRVAPKLLMSSSKRSGDITGSCTQVFADGNGPLLASTLVSNVSISGGVFQVGDVLILENADTLGELSVIRCVVEVADTALGLYQLKIESIPTTLVNTQEVWTIELEQPKPIFELKLGRFGYRYKYQDGEFSSFAPWSELAFLPGEFDYVPKKGYNLGMVNNLRDLKITDFVVEDSLRPDDVISVDILYKDTSSPNVYVVKTIERGKDPEWDESAATGSSGILEITSDMIHKALPSSQLLRAWDNVPRKAVAQEVTGNRVLYGNYLQNYNVPNPVAVIQRRVTKAHGDNLLPEASVKSIRKYKLGIVFGDKQGRETPVISAGAVTKDGHITTSDVNVEKKYAHETNKLSAQQDWNSPIEGWMDYYKYYIKETTNEYYNLAMDRWYDSEDGNIWLSFQSADRNKLDEDTYIILKNRHGSQDPVLDEARYKILAIENEAPDYIKTTAKILGSLNISEISSISTTNVIEFPGTAWDAAFSDIKFKGIGWARIKGVASGQVMYSAWARISRLNDSAHEVTLVDPIGESADMTSTLGTSGVEYRLEIKDAVVENRPEFDGKYFVKIYKDGVLTSNVLGESGDSITYITKDTFKHAYIQTAGTNPAVNGPFSGNSWTSGYGFNSGNVFNNFAKCGHDTESKDFWAGHGSNGFSSPWYLDRTRDRTNNSANTWKPGLHQNTGITNYSGMSFSIRRENFGSGNTLLFRTKMSTPGTLFRFATDPNNRVYEVKSGSGGEIKSYTYTRLTGLGACITPQDWGSSHKRTFTVKFAWIEDSGIGLDINDFDPRGALAHDGTTTASIHIVEPMFNSSESIIVDQGNAIWETEPKEDVGLDLYYEATNSLPMRLTEANNESFAPVGSVIEIVRDGLVVSNIVATYLVVKTMVRDVVSLRESTSTGTYTFNVLVGDTIRFIHADGAITESTVVDYMTTYDTEDNDYEISASQTPYLRLDNELYKYKTQLPWYNCYSFGNGLESDRIRDDYNAPTIDNGVKVSTTLDDYGQERRSSGLIYSGIYNSTSGTNNLNEFNMAESITKDLNPTYGSIQALKSRDTNVVAFCEDKVLKILANKDALFNADGSSNVTASSNVLGDASGFAGDYGISKNPESLALDNFRMYFSDKQRGVIIRLSQDGLTPVSAAGMTTWFRDNLKETHEIVGTYDEIKGEYNATLRYVPAVYDRHSVLEPKTPDTTVSFSEKTKGWTSFKSFTPQTGLSINGEYLTAKDGGLWSHYDKTTPANLIYGVHYDSTIDVLFNDNPGSVKSFGSMNYEGTQAKVSVNTGDGEYYNLVEKKGWHVTSFTTDLQEGLVPEFINKEGKWFNHIFGETTTLKNLDTSEFSVQGIGTVTSVVPPEQTEFTITIQNGE